MYSVLEEYLLDRDVLGVDAIRGWKGWTEYDIIQKREVIEGGMEERDLHEAVAEYIDSCIEYTLQKKNPGCSVTHL